MEIKSTQLIAMDRDFNKNINKKWKAVDDILKDFEKRKAQFEQIKPKTKNKDHQNKQQ